MSEDYQVQQGDSVSSIAYEHGFFWETLWNHAANSELKQKRKDPDILMQGDVVHIPDKTEKLDNGSTEKKHKFKLKGVPAMFTLQLRRLKKQDKAKTVSSMTDWWEYRESEPETVKHEPASDVPYVLYADGRIVAQGKTDRNGRLKAKLSPAATAGCLILYRGLPQEAALELNFRQMDPIDELPGICKRLNNLGFACPTDVLKVTPEVESALASFQRVSGLKITGEPDDSTREKLKQIHGG